MSSARLATFKAYNEFPNDKIVVDWEKHLPGSSVPGYIVKLVHPSESEPGFADETEIDRFPGDSKPNLSRALNSAIYEFHKLRDAYK